MSSTTLVQGKFVNAAAMRSRPKQPARRVNLKIKDRRIRQPVRQGRPSLPLIGRMPDADISTDINVIGVIAIHDYRVVLNIQKISSRRALRTTPWLPTVPIEMPHAARIPYAAERYVNRMEGCITPIDRDIRN